MLFSKLVVGTEKQEHMLKKSLKGYCQKEGIKKASKAKVNKKFPSNLYVIQKHESKTLHYDLRLSIDGVLKSWVVPKGLSLKVGEKRLAIRTEDHPIDYASFEGVIPKGQYGAGVVMVWDIGTFEPIYDNQQKKEPILNLVKKGALKITLKGKKLQGGFALVKMHKVSSQQQWLIFKLKDTYSEEQADPFKLQPNSVLTGCSLREISKKEKDASNP